MSLKGLAFCVVLVVAPWAHGDIEIELRPDHPGVYVPGEVVNVDVWFVDADSGHPITGEDILFRGYQLDFEDTDTTLGLPDEMNMPYPGWWGFPDLPRPSWIYPLHSEDPWFQMTLPAEGEMLVGDVDVTVNDTGWLDVMNPEDDFALGAWVRFGFGIDEDDPVVTWRAFTGELTGGRLFMDVPEPASLALLSLGGIAIRRRRPPL